MLDQGHHENSTLETIAALPCEVVLPDFLRVDFERRGFATTSHAERRRYPRYRLQGHAHRAALRYAPSLPALKRPPMVAGVFTTNISRGGVGFLHSEQMYPQERAEFVLPTGVGRVIEVAWCRRLGPRCFEVGARFLEDLSVPEVRTIIAED
jgi:hypothetical protein